ncbi:protein phosphatase 2C domain-containing protein [Frankia sp. Cpl3]|nr:PP2C family serine/threonine-protein phosphatase [Parafrankia colletiae]MCK9898925.1 protein phosphatase 2C domain-containing protein [Frankia sp. Cpl3]
MGSSLVPIMLIVVLLVGAVVFVVLSSRAPRTGYESGRRRTLETRRARRGGIPLRDTPPPEPPDGAGPDLTATPAAPVAAAPVITVADGGEPGGGSDGDPGAAGPAWGDGTGWVDWDGAEATRVTSLSDPGTDSPDVTGATTAGGYADTATSVTDGAPGAGHNIGGAYPARAGTAADQADTPYHGEYFAAGAQTGESHANAHSRDTPMNDSRDPDATGWTPPPSGRPHQTEVDDSAYRLPMDGQGRHPADGAYHQPGLSGYSGPASYPDPTAGETQRVSAGPDGPDALGQAPTWPDPAWGGAGATAGDAAVTVADAALSPESGAAGIVAPEPAQTTAPALRLAAAGRTRRGKRGGPNEDAYVVSDGLLAVSDGVGGEAAGQIASTLTVTTVAGFRPQYARDPADGLRQAVARANQVVREKPREEPAWRGMACTLDVVILGRQQSTGETLFIAHVGDSSVWLQPQKGRPHQITTPHAIKNGPLLNAVGLADHIEADILREPVRAGDRVILASDGITKVMTPEQLLGLMTELGAEPPERAADALVEAALLAGARDDTTIVVADVVSEPAAR